MNGVSMGKLKRPLTFSIAVILLMAVFFTGYFFYYIPANRKNLQKDAFLILQGISETITTRNHDFSKLYRNYLKKEDGKVALFDSIRDRFVYNKIEGKVAWMPQKDTSGSSMLTDAGTAASAEAGEVRLTGIRKDSLIYRNAALKDVAIVLPLPKLINDILANQREEFFSSYLIINRDGGLLYKDPGLGIRSDVTIDTLISRRNDAFFSGTKEMILEGEDYKMFYYPFNLEDNQLVLCGFIRSDEYATNLRRIPVLFVYPLVIAFLLLLIAIPVIKFLIMGIDEQIRMYDLMFFVLSLFAGATLVTIIIIQVLLVMGATHRAEGDLTNISAQVERSFTSEIERAYLQMEQLDNFCKTYKYQDTGKHNFSAGLKHFLWEHRNGDSTYFNLDRISWINSSGKQWIKGELDSVKPVFADVSDRRYFKLYRDDAAYPLPGHPGKTFGFESIFSSTTGEFGVIISKRSEVNGAFIVALSIKMHSVSGSILPPGYGFCIFDPDGNVQLHSESGRNLHENILKKQAYPRLLKEVISSRQQKFFPELLFYGKSHASNVKPVDKLPFFLMTFCDKGYVVPVNMRILIFSLIGCVFSYGLCILMWLLVFRKRLYSDHLLYAPMDIFQWIIPKARYMRFYEHSIVLLAVYVVSLLILMSVSEKVEGGNSAVLMAIVFTPVNLMAGLFVISCVTCKEEKMLRLFNNKATMRCGYAGLLIIGGLFIITLLLSVFSDDYPPYGWFSQLLFLLGIWLYFLLVKKNTAVEGQPPYYARYAWFVVMLAICLAVLPASIYTWYAHNQEITQTVKKQQLYLAKKVEDRRRWINRYFCYEDTCIQPPAGYLGSQVFCTGIYSISNDQIFQEDKVFRAGFRKETHNWRSMAEKFYFDVAERTSNNYYDPQFYPVLSDMASDTSWYWVKNGRQMYFYYDIMTDTRVNNKDNIISIISKFPVRYMFVAFSVSGLLLALFVILLLWGLYHLVYAIAERIFLRKYIIAVKNKSFTLPDGEEGNQLVYTGRNMGDQYLTKEERYEAEQQLCNAVEANREYYEGLWKACSDKEKYLLFDFAHDGLMNFKNIPEIYSLFRKRIFMVDKDQEVVELFSDGFRAFILGKKRTEDMLALQKKYEKNSTWQTFRVPLLIMLLSVAAFIFFTQEAVFQKIVALLVGVSSISSVLVKLSSSSRKEEDVKP